MSSIGAMFAPHHQAVADELVRVCRPGGTIGMLNWTPEGMIGALFRTMGPFAPPPPPGAQPPPLWGGEDHCASCSATASSGGRSSATMLEITAFGQPHDYGEHFKAYYGPTIVAQANAEKDGREAELDAAIDALLRRVEPRHRRPGALRAGVPDRRGHPPLAELLDTCASRGSRTRRSRARRSATPASCWIGPQGAEGDREFFLATAEDKLLTIERTGAFVGVRAEFAADPARLALFQGERPLHLGTRRGRRARRGELLRRSATWRGTWCPARGPTCSRSSRASRCGSSGRRGGAPGSTWRRSRSSAARRCPASSASSASPWTRGASGC